ncbi:hypothetical protein BGZ63DRAFT_273822 [Mariannaea sp. PMI_226]|nr:hypothetical protein BGZ63DRAFT_273822 [Mariannaea sp. PMI_226]
MDQMEGFPIDNHTQNNSQLNNYIKQEVIYPFSCFRKIQALFQLRQNYLFFSLSGFPATWESPVDLISNSTPCREILDLTHANISVSPHQPHSRPSPAKAPHLLTQFSCPSAKREHQYRVSRPPQSSAPAPPDLLNADPSAKQGTPPPINQPTVPNQRPLPRSNSAGYL